MENITLSDHAILTYNTFLAYGNMITTGRYISEFYCGNHSYYC